MDWTAGYASDVEYTAGFYREQAPGALNFTCILNGIEPVPTDTEFTYFELGFGRGLTANVLAAAHANGRFYAADFNPAHVAGARQLAADAKLTNLTLLENSFEDLAEGQVDGLPQFDFITLHGIYTWVTVDNRRHIVNFIKRYLKPGGLVYASYNAMPGWSSALPLQRLIVEHADLHPDRSDAQVKAAAQFIDKLSEAKAGFFAVNPGLKPRLDTLKTGGANYLVHEYMHKHWQPMYFADVARDLADAKLDFAGSADPSANYHGLFLSAEKLELVKSNPDAIFTETIKDYFLNTSFRKDVFVRGARRMTPARQAEWLARTGLQLLVPRDTATLSLKLPNGEVNARPEIYNPVLDALERGPQTLGQLAELPALGGTLMRSLAQVAALLVSSGQAEVFIGTPVRASVATATQMNRALANKGRFGDEYQALVSPVMGTGIVADFMERFVYHALTQKIDKSDNDALAQHSWKLLQAQGRLIVKEGKALQSPEENMAEIRDRVAVIVNKRLPLWRAMGII